MHRRGIFALPLLFVEAAWRLASASHLLSRSWRCAVLHRTVSDTYRVVALRPPAAAAGRCGHDSVSRCQGHTRLLRSRLLRHGRPGIRRVAIEALEWPLHLG